MFFLLLYTDVSSISLRRITKTTHLRGLRWVVFLGCRSVCLFSLLKACLQGFLPSSKNWFLSAASAEGSSACLGVDYIKNVF